MRIIGEKRYRFDEMLCKLGKIIMKLLTTCAIITIIALLIGEVAEWLMAADCKSALYEYAGSNPALSTIENRGYTHLAIRET